MKRLLLLATALCALVSTASAAVDPNDVGKARVEKSPRHLEWVTVKHDGREVKCFVGYPEVKTKATAVVLIHEIFGLSDWMRGMVDQFAAAGYVVIAPDLLTGLGPNGGGTESLGGADGARAKIGGLPALQVNADLDACVDYVKKLPACNGKVVVGGFCWGGGKTLVYAMHNPDIKAGLPFYGTPSAKDLTDTKGEFSAIKAPIYGFYGGNDARINTTIPDTTAKMLNAGKTYEPVTYEGAGHGYMRAGEPEDASPENKKARDESWTRIKAILSKI